MLVPGTDHVHQHHHTAAFRFVLLPRLPQMVARTLTEDGFGLNPEKTLLTISHDFMRTHTCVWYKDA